MNVKWVCSYKQTIIFYVKVKWFSTKRTQARQMVAIDDFATIFELNIKFIFSVLIYCNKKSIAALLLFDLWAHHLFLFFTLDSFLFTKQITIEYISIFLRNVKKKEERRWRRESSNSYIIFPVSNAYNLPVLRFCIINLLSLFAFILTFSLDKIQKYFELSNNLWDLRFWFENHLLFIY